MVPNSLTHTPTPDPGVKRSKFIFSEHGHVVFKI